MVHIAKSKHHEWLQEDNLIRIESWARLGLTDEQIAKNMGISTATLYSWKNKYVEILEALKKGKAPVDFEVENALFKRAIGFQYEEVETIEEEVDGTFRTRVKRTQKTALPDTSAMIFWLKNRKPNEWRKLNAVVEAKLKAETEKLHKEAESLSNESTGDVVFINDIPLED